MTLVEAKELRKIFGSIRALDGVTVEISEGITLILGSNGGEKSTFLKLATGVYRPTSEEIKVFGENPWNNWRVKKRFGVAYDPPAFPQFTTGREWLTLFAESKGFGEDEVERVVELFEVKPFIDKRINCYSSGMLKRLSLAQAFIGEPELVFLDEPLANIDFDSMERVIEIIDGMRKTNFVKISHIWEPLMPIVDWVIVIGNVRLILNGKADEVQEDVEKLFKPRIARKKGAQKSPPGRRVDKLQAEVNHLKWKPLPPISRHQIYINFSSWRV
ncbi:ATP-binding cassette domain-containing protein [Thermococcus piezophilus]|uniref:ATP-binding cassette domain-containing protein n=1 Tax=Thermococcus piezophilus TaxID=1712654 RepID=UPI000AC38777|nr:ABC transporter ATP-binding protein [Thermococcus piezophilus]